MSQKPEGSRRSDDRSTLVARLVIFGLLGVIAAIYFIESYFR
jgi:hypothetical protein